jgi:transposase
MAVPFLVCTKKEQRSVVCFLWADGMKQPEIHTFLCSQYRDNAVSWRSVYRWIEMCKKGQKNVTDEHLGHLSKSTTNEKLEEDRDMVLEGRRVSVAEISQELNTSHKSVYSAV